MRSIGVNAEYNPHNSNHHHRNSTNSNHSYGTIAGGESPTRPYFASPSTCTTSSVASFQMESPTLAASSFASSSVSPTLIISPTQATTIQSIDSGYDSESSSLRFIVAYTRDLPSLSDVKAACDCYIDECGKNGSSFQLCYVNQGQLEEIWLHLCSMQISKLELALLYAVLATIGNGTPARHPSYQLTSVRSSESQATYIQKAMEILQNETSVNDEESSYLFTRCQALALVSWYYQSTAQYDVSWDYIQQTITAAHACHLFDLQEWTNATPAKLFTVKILQMDIPYMYNWIIFTRQNLEDCHFQPNFPEPSVLIEVADPLERARLQSKVEGSSLARRVSIHSQASKFLPRDILIQVGQELDEEVIRYMESLPLLREVPSFLKIEPTDRGAIKLAESVILFRGGMMLLRFRIMTQLFKDHPVDYFQLVALSSSRLILKLLSLVQKCFLSPWLSITTKSWIDGFFNGSMFTFLAAINSHLHEPPPLGINDQPNTTNLNTSIRAELVWFMSNFDLLSEGMNKLGFIRTDLRECAEALRKTPVQRQSNSKRLSSSSASALPTSNKVGDNDDLHNNTSYLSAIPLVKLSTDEFHLVSNIRNVSQFFQNEYEYEAQCKSAYSAQAKPGQR
ncbi:hypothetical protein CBS101457_004842 [Exobasidium rhododendri]|nr:hypothetical protein CBS101457_004842 [Exobasidium rhododendri]